MGTRHACAIKSDGTLACWGAGDNGRLGDGSGNSRSTPVYVSALGTGVAQVAAGGTHTCAVKTDGSLWCWGYNAYGQLGDGTTTGRVVPTLVAGGHAFAAVSAGPIVPFFGHTCGVTTSGAVYCWGDNLTLQLGVPALTHSNAPVRVM